MNEEKSTQTTIDINEIPKNTSNTSRESLSPIAHRKSSIQINYNTHQYTNTYAMNYENSEFQQNDNSNCKSTLLSENSLSFSENPCVLVDSSNDIIIPTK